VLIIKKEEQMEDKHLFLQELTELSKKYNIYIGGCGCCDSPYLLDEPGETDGELVWFDDKYVASDKEDV
jgi:hypothetical protein